jgi:hypothetical protein
MSPRAALRLEMFGFTRVYDYVAGKNDWTAAMLPVEGNGELPPRASDALSRDVRTCRPEDRIDALRAGGRCVVTSDAGVVLGLLTSEDLRAPADGTGGIAHEPRPDDHPSQRVAWPARRTHARGAGDARARDQSRGRATRGGPAWPGGGDVA